MTTELETLRIIGSWLEEGRTRLPDHVLDAALDQLPATPQRRPSWPARRIAELNALAKFEIAAAAVLVAVAIVGLNLLGSSGTRELGNAPPTAVVSPSPSTGLPTPAGFGPVDPGTYQRTLLGVGQLTFVIPEGWTWKAGGIEKDVGTPREIGATDFLPGAQGEVTHVYRDACRSAGQLERIGPTVNELVAALDAQDGTDVVTAAYSTGSAVGRRVEVRETPGLDRSKCRYGSGGALLIAADEFEGNRYALEPQSWGVVYALDFDGTRLAFAATFGPDATDDDAAAVDAIVESFDFTSP